MHRRAGIDLRAAGLFLRPVRDGLEPIARRGRVPAQPVGRSDAEQMPLQPGWQRGEPRDRIEIVAPGRAGTQPGGARVGVHSKPSRQLVPQAQQMLAGGAQTQRLRGDGRLGGGLRLAACGAQRGARAVAVRVGAQREQRAQQRGQGVGVAARRQPDEPVRPPAADRRAVAATRVQAQVAGQGAGVGHRVRSRSDVSLQDWRSSRITSRAVATAAG